MISISKSTPFYFLTHSLTFYHISLLKKVGCNQEISGVVGATFIYSHKLGVKFEMSLGVCIWFGNLESTKKRIFVCVLIITPVME